MRIFSGRTTSYRSLLAMTAFLALAVGCENNNPLASATFYPVKGKVLLPDGKPLTAGHVVFVSTKTTTTATATIESDGSFSFKECLATAFPRATISFGSRVGPMAKRTRANRRRKLRSRASSSTRMHQA